jgi:hypothetical protein
MKRKQTENAPRMMNPGAPAMEQENGDMKFLGECCPSFGDDMKMSVEETGGMQHHNPAIPDQPKTMRFLTK